MPTGVPPKGDRAAPRFREVPPGTLLWRVTAPAQPSIPEAEQPLFRAPAREVESHGGRWGGRFDATPDCPYPFCYAAFDDLTALCEVLLRDVPFGAEERYLPHTAVAGRRLVLLETLRPLWLVSLLGAADLAAARQDTWLVHTDDVNYPITRLWAHWLRDGDGSTGQGPPAGLVWPSKRQPTGRAVLLFGDRCGDAVRYSSLGSLRLDQPPGLDWLNRRLALVRTRIGPPWPGPSV